MRAEGEVEGEKQTPSEYGALHRARSHNPGIMSLGL